MTFEGDAEFREEEVRNRKRRKGREGRGEGRRGGGSGRRSQAETGNERKKLHGG